MKRLFEAQKRKERTLHRRDALKLIGLGSAGLMTGGSISAQAETSLSVPSSKKKAKIIIAGGGTGGITVAARLRRSVPNAQITLIAPNETHLYQSGQVFVAAGLYSEFDNKRATEDILPDGVKWLQEKITAFDPDNHRVHTEKSGELSYDYLVVALGCEYDFSAIEGINAEDIGKEGIASVYLNDTLKGISPGALITKLWFESIRRNAAKRPQNVLLCEPDTPVKGEGVSFDMLFLCNDILRGNGVRKGEDLHQNVHFTLTKPGHTLFPSKPIADTLQKEMKKAGNTETKFSHRLLAVNKSRKTAEFEVDGKRVEYSYDYLHITPPMRAPEVVQNSPLAIKEGRLKGWMEVDSATLQHPKYPDVFGIGDVLGLSSGKSGGAVREQAILIQDNLAAFLEKKTLPIHYNGYSVSPIKTRYGRVLLAEYDNHGLAPTFPLDPTVPRWIWWEMDLHLMRAAYFGLMMRGML